MKEVWKDIKRYEGVYQVSNCGNVKNIITNKILKRSINQNGYIFYALYKNGLAKRFRGHQLVAQAFLSNPNNYKYVNHKNGKKDDNTIMNLEWCSASQNMKHSYDIGLHKKYCGQNNKKSIPIAQLDLEGNLIKIWDNQTIASKSLKIPRSNIWSVLKGRRKTAHNYKWKYVLIEEY